MRDLTQEEHDVLAHAVIDPVEWWANVCSKDGSDGKHKLDAEKCLTDKMARWCGEHDEQCVHPDYKNRAERQAVEDDENTPYVGLNHREIQEATIIDLTKRLEALEK